MTASSPASATGALSIWTIGHSTRPMEEFLALLAHWQIEAVADVRRFPGSRRCPHFGRTALEGCLPQHQIEYRWLPALGGRRRPVPSSPNTAWRNPSFRGYADYMQTAEFTRALEELLEMAGHRRTAAMCAELLWWRCHRSMIADAALVRGVAVTHILDATHSAPHLLTKPASVVHGRLTYESKAGGTFQPR